MSRKVNKNVPELRFPEFGDDWKIKELKEIAKFSKGKGLSKENIVKNGNLKCIRYAELYTKYNEVIDHVISSTNIDSRELVLSLKNDVIIPSSGESAIDIARASCVQQSGIALGGDINIIRTQVLNSIFFAYYLNNTKKIDIAQIAQGNTVVHLYSSQLAQLKISFPSFAEQEKIASFLGAIATRLTQLRRKHELLQTYKRGVMQKLFSQQIRFNRDDGKPFPDWQKKKLNQVFERITRKNKENNLNTLTISAQHGLINQRDFFNKSVAADDLTGYYLLKRGDFAYNKSYSNGYPMGAIKRLKFYKKGVVSTLYICFSTENEVEAQFYEKYFEGGFLNHELSKIAQEGARNHGLLNMSVVEFFRDITLDYPNTKEQEKIADFLTAIDKKIEAVAKQIDLTEQFKKGLLQKMFV